MKHPRHAEPEGLPGHAERCVEDAGDRRRKAAGP